MDKVIWKLLGEWSCFVGNILVGVKDVFLLSCTCLNVGCRGILKHIYIYISYLYILRGFRKLVFFFFIIKNTPKLSNQQFKKWG